MPSPSKSATKSSPGRTSIARVHEPGRITWPASSRTPKPATLRASQATAVTGLPSTASERPSATTSPLRRSVASMVSRSMSRGLTRSGPSTKPAEDALSAMVSTRPILQSRMRLSISSIAGATASVASRTSSSVQPSPGSVAPRMKPTSTSTRG